MKSRYSTYYVIRKIHLYASLSTVALLLMYLVTSYMMIYHSWFQSHDNVEQVLSIKVDPLEVSEDNWKVFKEKYAVKGRKTREYLTESGDLYREYVSAGGNFKITIFKNKNEVEIKSVNKNLAGNIIGFHRLRGFGGPLQYNIYAILLDAVGLSLIIFAITGVILWLKLLKNNKIAWTILISGFVYVSLIISYLLFV